MSLSLLRQSTLKDDEEEKQIVEQPVIEQQKPVSDKTASGLELLRQSSVEQDDETTTTLAQQNIEGNSAIREAAMRFARDRLGIYDVSEDDAMEEFVEHFRAFNVNELTAANDYRYVSAAASDATKRGDDKAAQRLSDYRLLHQTFAEMPAFSDNWLTATGDYAEGILTAPSTYVGLLLPGAGKAGGVAAQQAAKLAVQQTLKQSLKSPVSTLAAKAAANPIKTAVAVEGTAGSLQNIAAQKAEIAADLRDDYNPTETALAFGLSGAPVAVLGSVGKGILTRKVEEGTGDLVEQASKAVDKANEKAITKAEKTLEKNKEVASTLSSALRPLDPEQVALGKEVRDDIGEQVGLKPSGDTEGLARTLDADQKSILAGEPTLVVSIDEQRTKRIFAATVDIMKKTDKGLLEGERVTEGVARTIRTMNDKKAGQGDAFYRAVLKEYNLTHDDFANLLMADVSDAARKLQQASAASRAFKNLNAVASDNLFALNDVAKASVEKVGKAIEKGDVRKALDATDEMEGNAKEGFFKKLDSVRLASMTSQTATTVRNTVSGYGRVGIDTVTKAVDRGIARFLGQKVETPNEDILAVAYGLVNKKESKAVREIFEMGFHKKASQLFRELQDIEAGGGVKMTRMRHYSRELNALNTLSDNMFKRAAFVGSLKRQLNEAYTKKLKAGDKVNIDDYNLVEVIKRGDFNKVFGGKEGGKLLDKSVEDALYFTYQKSPSNPAARAIIQGIHSAPFLTTSLVPFPRFIANAMRFTYEYSPLYILQGAKRSFFRDENNYEEVSKALVGTGMITGAYAFRSSEYAGENWWEGKTADGKTYDLRPFFPAAPYLFVADLIKRGVDGDPLFGDRNFITDAIQALTGTQFRAGFGIYAIDSALKDLFRDDIDTSQKAESIAANFGANIISTFTIPLTAGQDLYNTFLAPDDELIIRQTNSSNVFDLMVNKSLARIPANYRLEQLLADSIGLNPPEIYEFPTRDEPMRRQTPISRQFAGILLQERRNFLENEMARLKISRRKLSQKTGVPEADQLINALIGEYATNYIVPVLQNSQKYKEAPSDEQAAILKAYIDDFRGDVMELVKLRSRTSGVERYGFDPMQRAAFNKLSAIAQKRAKTRYEKMYPNYKEKGYDYEELVRLGKYFEKLGPRFRLD